MSGKKQNDSRVWMPFTQMENASPHMVSAGEGPMLNLEDGRQVMDCISSWWVNLHGHSEPSIARAISAQAARLEQVIAAGFTHRPAEDLARRLVEKLPERSSRVFYSDNGSTAVEVALKMAVQYWRNLGLPHRSRFLAFEGGYHGDTVGAMSVSSRAGFGDAFAGLLFETDYLPFPATFNGDRTVEKREDETLEQLEGLLASRAERYAAMVIEPLVQGAAGMRMCRPQFLTRLAQLLARFDILQIYDEVLVGFGRTGSWFACQKAGTTPDLVCLAKGLTGGFLPLAATVCTDAIFDAFRSTDLRKTFFHGHSYSANPLGCAAALASMDLLEGLGEKLEEIESWHREGLVELASDAPLHQHRVCGTIAAVDLKSGDGAYLGPTSRVLSERFLERGFLLRPIASTIYVLPPYCIERRQVQAIYECIDEVVKTI
jgi:adenosylmethionine-8-amino-7-oxononanoate aminotransferase